MEQITWEQGAALFREIGRTPPGDWTHDLNTIQTGPARVVSRVEAPGGLEIVYFRMPDGSGAWPGANWDRFAVPRQPQLVEQMTLF
ncbi:hypothetical protein FRY98_24705 [Paenibacillus faecis]|uniref:Uncharacterized protein n=1 Tax=Paenibacillus faecis TaxID=862114 RepID=A0A5D0CN20_9BACL|nr:hypothetical protein [Paenibacillus faecis]TYA10970.1 hypothetical protein FRY98_24705 [Paenibacillus faecis]